MLTACHDNTIDSVIDGEETSQLYTYNVSMEVQAGEDGSKGTRSLTQDGTTIHSAWEKGDKIFAYSIKDGDACTLPYYCELSANEAGKFSKFNGTVSGKNAITTADEICFFYPGEAALQKGDRNGNNKIVAPVEKKEQTYTNKETGKTATSIMYLEQPTIMQHVELNVTNQDGTVETIGKKFDFQWAKAKPRDVIGNDIKITAGTLKRKISIAGLKFALEDGALLTDIDSIYISNVAGTDVIDLATGEWQGDNEGEEANTIVLRPAGDNKFAKNADDYVYAAILPDTYEDLTFYVFKGDMLYERTYSSVKYEEDKVYHSTVRNMKEVTQKPYVEVQGTKWATGNFIHYQDENGEYWGIAPAQWWIAQRGMMTGGVFTTSQFASSPKAIVNDLDLFRFGVIAKALELTTLAGSQYRAGFVSGSEITKRFFTGNIGRNEIPANADGTPNTEGATHGDIVWYYTKDKKSRYHMPEDKDFEALFKKANAIPAYCSADNGMRIYGAYFTTCKENHTRLKNFPTGVRKLEKYSNVTALVRANKGLFLPITGRCTVTNDVMGYRDMNYGAGAYGQYMSGFSSTGDLSRDFFFGPSEWSYAGNGKGQAKAIRPVWDSTDPDAPEDPVFESFKNIK
jgi:hypothetical protein